METVIRWIEQHECWAPIANLSWLIYLNLLVGWTVVALLESLLAAGKPLFFVQGVYQTVRFLLVLPAHVSSSESIE